MQEYNGEEVTVSGDGRCDSPGKCAKFCTYTLMETSKNTILHSETIDKREVQNKSPNMEREAVDRALKKLKERVNVVEITTDSSTSVTKMLGMLFYIFTILAYLWPIAADKHPRVLHSMDTWHKAKLLKKVLNNVRFIPNHIYVMIICNIHAQCSSDKQGRKLL